MKKTYFAPEAAIVDFAAENMMALSIQINTGEHNGETAGSNGRILLDEELDEEWD